MNKYRGEWSAETNLSLGKTFSRMLIKHHVGQFKQEKQNMQIYKLHMQWAQTESVRGY